MRSNSCYACIINRTKPKTMTNPPTAKPMAMFLKNLT